jgi:hypothetical protein
MTTTPLSNIINKEVLPEQLSFLADGLDTVFDNLSYNQLDVFEDLRGQNISYNINLIADYRLVLEFPGTGIAFVLNPSYDGSGPSEFPMSVSIHKGILGYIKGFDISSFNNATDSFINIAKKIVPVNDAEIIA